MDRRSELLAGVGAEVDDLAARLADARRRDGLTQREMAHRLGTTLWNLNRLETGAAQLRQQPVPLQEAVAAMIGSTPIPAAPVAPPRRPLPSATPPTVRTRTWTSGAGLSAPELKNGNHVPNGAPNGAHAAPAAPAAVEPPAPVATPAPAAAVEPAPAPPAPPQRPIRTEPVAKPPLAPGFRPAPITPERKPPPEFGPLSPRNLPRRVWQIAGGVLLLIGLVAGALALFGGDGASERVATPDRPAPQSTASPAPTPEPTPDPAAIAAESDAAADQFRDARAAGAAALRDARRAERRRLRREAERAQAAPAPTATPTPTTTTPAPVTAPAPQQKPAARKPEQKPRQEPPADEPGRTPPPTFVRP